MIKTIAITNEQMSKLLKYASECLTSEFNETAIGSPQEAGMFEKAESMGLNHLVEQWKENTRIQVENEQAQLDAMTEIINHLNPFII